MAPQMEVLYCKLNFVYRPVESVSHFHCVVYWYELHSAFHSTYFCSTSKAKKLTLKPDFLQNTKIF